MVARKVKARLPRTVEFGDLEGAGGVGLIQAIQSFDPGRGVPFEAFCEYRVRGAILDELRRHDWVPRPVRNRLNKLKVVVEELRSTLEREPNEIEIAAELGLELHDYHRLYGGGRDTPVLAGGKPANDQGDSEGTLDFYEDPRDYSPDDGAHSRELLELISQTLDAEEREILFMRFFLDYSLREIGDIRDISQSRVSKILGRIMERLKVRFEEKI
jgi:RNA polymerase sigma factor for flagellar operon FliA